MTHDTVLMPRRPLVQSILLLVLWMAAVGSVSATQTDGEVPFVTPLTVEEMTGKQVVLETEYGLIVIDLRPELAPNHVGLIMQFATDGTFNGTTFHRMVANGVVQGGDPFTADKDRVIDYGRGGLGLVTAEIRDAMHDRGAVSAVMVQGEPSSSGAQFFICVVPQPALDGLHTIWGQVVDGMDVVTKISQISVDEEGRAATRVAILTATIRDKPPLEVPPFSTYSDEELSAFRAVLTTTYGQIGIEFYPNLAPNHVRNFLRLVDLGVYDGTAFHRVVPGFVIQAGHLPTRRAPLTDRQQRFVQNLDPEFNDTAHVRGIVSMARFEELDSASTSFFICTDVAEQLDRNYTAFGVVTAGFDAISEIEKIQVDGETPTTRVEIISASVVRR